MSSLDFAVIPRLSEGRASSPPSKFPKPLAGSIPRLMLSDPIPRVYSLVQGLSKTHQGRISILGSSYFRSLQTRTNIYILPVNALIKIRPTPATQCLSTKIAFVSSDLSGLRKASLKTTSALERSKFSTQLSHCPKHVLKYEMSFRTPAGGQELKDTLKLEAESGFSSVVLMEFLKTGRG